MSAEYAARIAEIIGPVVAITLVGFLLARRTPMDMSVPNRLSTHCLLPALIFASLVNMRPDLATLARLGAFSAFVVLGSGVLALALFGSLRLRLRTMVPPMMFKNYGNLGLPLALFAFGEEGLALMVVLAVTGNTLHLSVGFWILRGRLSAREMLCEPMIAAAIAGCAVALLQMPLPAFVLRTVELLGNASIPLMLLALGARLVGCPITRVWPPMLAGAACPAFGLLCFLALDAATDLQDTERRVMLVFSVLPPAVLNFMFAERFNVEPERVAATVLSGTLLSLVSIPLALMFAV